MLPLSSYPQRAQRRTQKAKEEESVGRREHMQGYLVFVSSAYRLLNAHD